MKKISLCIITVLLLSACQKPLYKYKSYDEAAFKYSVYSEEKDIKKALKGYKEIVEGDKNKKSKKKSNAKNTVPPGACADYAYLLLLQRDTTKAITFFDKEMLLYPESTAYIKNLKKKLGL